MIQSRSETNFQFDFAEYIYTYEKIDITYI